MKQCILFILLGIYFSSSLQADESEDLGERLGKVEKSVIKIERALNDGQLPAQEVAAAQQTLDLSNLISKIHELEKRVAALEGVKPRIIETAPEEQDQDSLEAIIIQAQEGSPGSSAAAGDFEAHYNQGLGLLKQGELTAAVDSFLYCLKHYPEAKRIGNVLLQLGKAYLALGQPSEAKKTLVKAYRKSPLSPLAPQALFYLAKAFAAEGHPAQACTVLKAMGKKYPHLEGTLKDELVATVKELQCQ